ncbi:hypothetical protein [Desulfurobacterium atlanticum]|nr:hypothetical protein [Desulfurobacterium atlanticum]
MRKIKLKVKTAAKMQPIFGKTAQQLLDEFINIATKEIMALNKDKVSNKAFAETFLSPENLQKLEKLKIRLKNLEKEISNKKVIYDLFHSIFRNYRWAVDSGSEKEIEIKVWIASSIDKIERILFLLGNKNERD